MSASYDLEDLLRRWILSLTRLKEAKEAHQRAISAIPDGAAEGLYLVDLQVVRLHDYECNKQRVELLGNVTAFPDPDELSFT